MPGTPARIDYFKNSGTSHKRIYVGAAEHAPPYLLNQYYYMLDSLFKISCPKTIEYKFELIENEDHWGVPLIDVYKGLQYIFEDWKIPMKVIENADIASLKVHINERSAQYGYGVKYPEFLFNFIAMEFLEPEAEHTVSEEKMVTAAKDLVEMNLENYPSSSNAHFNLEMYHLHVNENEEAIGMFEMALEIDTEHQMAKHYLAKANKANN